MRQEDQEEDRRRTILRHYGINLSLSDEQAFSKILRDDDLEHVEFGGTLYAGYEQVDVQNFLFGPVQETLRFYQRVLEERRPQELLKLAGRLDDMMKKNEAIEQSLSDTIAESRAGNMEYRDLEQRYRDTVDVLQYIYTMFEGSSIALPAPPRGMLVQNNNFAGDLAQLQHEYATPQELLASQTSSTPAAQPPHEPHAVDSLLYFDDDLL